MCYTGNIAHFENDSWKGENKYPQVCIYIRGEPFFRVTKDMVFNVVWLSSRQELNGTYELILYACILMNAISADDISTIWWDLIFLNL